MTQYFPVVVEQEDNGSFSAWIAGLPGVYAAADTAAVAKRSIRSALAAHLRALGATPHVKAEVTVLRYESARSPALRFAGLGALLGRSSTAAKVAAARRNGLKGGRPRKHGARERSNA